MKIFHDRKTTKLWLSQEAYVEKVLERFNMSNAKSVCSQLAGHFKLSFDYCPISKKEKQEIRRVSYASAVGSLIYVIVCTRLDIVHAIGVGIRFLSNLGKVRWTVLKWILRYLKGTSRTCLCFNGDKHMLQVYTDADMVGDTNSK